MNNNKKTMTVKEVKEATANFSRDELIVLLTYTLENEARLRSEIDKNLGIVR